INEIDAVMIVELKHNGSDDVVQSWTQPAAGHNSAAQLARIEIDVLARAGEFKTRLIDFTRMTVRRSVRHNRMMQKRFRCGAYVPMRSIGRRYAPRPEFAHGEVDRLYAGCHEDSQLDPPIRENLPTSSGTCAPPEIHRSLVVFKLDHYRHLAVEIARNR